MTSSSESTNGVLGRSVRYGDGRTALLDAAIAVVARAGTRGLTYRALAREAHVSHALVSHHFGSIDSLLAEALTHSIQRSMTDTGLVNDLDGVEGFVANLAEAVQLDPELQRFQFEVTLEAARRPDLYQLVVDLYERYRDAIRQDLAQLGIKDEQLVTTVLATLDGLILYQVTVGTADNTRAGLDGIRRLLSDHLASREAEARI